MEGEDAGRAPNLPNHGFIGVHVGAGFFSKKLQKEYRELCEKACSKGVEILRNGGSSVEAATAATIILEDSELTNAGIGSNLSFTGRVECDASIMDGQTMNVGSVGAVPGVQNPILLAKRICEKQQQKLPCGLVPPSFLVGKGAYLWAKTNDIKTVEPRSMISKKSLRQYKHYKRKLKMHSELPILKSSKLDTVGVVCVDKTGHMAATSSSGGIILKHPGRVGQAAVFGCGCWAENGTITEPGVATSTTGCGEHLIRTSLARTVANAVKSDCSTQGVYNALYNGCLNRKTISTAERACGVIVLRYSDDEKFEFMWAHSTNSMCVGYMSTDSKKPYSRLSRLPPEKQPGNTILVEGICCDAK
ncbi:unnamed protein product [Bemisia tabaci]|uniref:Threonine aspartase 1 n=1 Tax=Bemisia tabaci TaxID=7038 RepID=A0A9P0AFL8_BEMTA|nr:unnamed protein product [Bemisia tabaci]